MSPVWNGNQLIHCPPGPYTVYPVCLLAIELVPSERVIEHYQFQCVHGAEPRINGLLHCVPVVTSFFSPPPAASSISSESSPVSSPATNHSSPVSTPKRGPLGPGPVLVPPVGHSVPNTPPVVTIAPTKTSNGLWRSEGRQVRRARGHSLFAVFFVLSLCPHPSLFMLSA